MSGLCSTDPDWRSLVASLTARGIRVLGYANGMLNNVTQVRNFESLTSEMRTCLAHLVFHQVPPAHLLEEALSLGYLATVDGVALSPGLVDLTNPAARTWYAQVRQFLARAAPSYPTCALRFFAPQVLAQNLLADPAKGGGGLSGFMADFGESLPLQAGLQLYDPHYTGLTLAQLHNAWPLLWQTLCEEAVAYAAANDLLPNGTTADDIVFFTRSASAQTPGHSRYV